ncbi:unnamed protein product [Linum trigynum]|uniref:F-box domain-containing protein n=1 Tax=Linum trigynum TaxID=586398 RepID=A0AAV2FIJ7_9ROSI
MVRDLTELGRGDGEDRISQIPDEIIHTILCCLNSPEAAAKTSVLSRRWLHLWRSFPHVEFQLSKQNQSRFRSFVESTSAKLLRLLSDSDHSNSGSSCATVATIEDFSIYVDDDFQKEDIDRLLLLISNGNGLSPVMFVLGFKSHPGYSLLVPNWSRTKFVALRGCDLTSATTLGFHDNLGSLEFLRLDNVSLSEELLHRILANSPCLASLNLYRIFGIDRLEVVSSPCLGYLYLGYIDRGGRRGSECPPEEMRRLRVSSPKLKKMSIWQSLEELDIDAPNLVSLFVAVNPSYPLMKVNVVNLASDCQSTVFVVSYVDEFTPQWLRLSLSTTFTQFRHLILRFTSCFSLSEQQVPHLSQAEYAAPPPRIDELQFGPVLERIRDIEEAAAFVNSLFWACLPQFMSIAKGEDSALIAEYMCREYLKLSSPSGMNEATSWTRHLKDMKIENGSTGEVMEISEDVIPSLPEQKKVRFMLTWC